MNKKETKKTKIESQETKQKSQENKINNQPAKSLTNLDLLMLSSSQDSEAFERADFAENPTFKTRYEDFYNDVKQKNNFVKQDW